MSFMIIMDSGGEVPVQFQSDPRFVKVPMEIEVGDWRIVDDEKLNQEELLSRIDACKTCPKSSCPSPDSYMEACKVDADDIFIVTIAGNLSGSFNSACLGRDLFHEEVDEDKNIFVIDSYSTAGGEAQIAWKALELCEQGLPFEQVCKELTKYRDAMRTYFVLDNLDTLRKNGRLTGVKAVVASSLNIKPVMSADKGVIYQMSQSIGVKKALKKMVDIMTKECADPTGKRVIINQVKAMERAELVKSYIEENMPGVGEIIIQETSGISTLYANEGGIIVTI